MIQRDDERWYGSISSFRLEWEIPAVSGHRISRDDRTGAPNSWKRKKKEEICGGKVKGGRGREEMAWRSNRRSCR